jgi:phosphopantothenoylcysteine decarboxylase/phosphopantothenate--cysteine ligase
VLAGRRIVLGVTGGVAAYKAAYLARRLIEHGAVVRCVMTESATEFLGPASLAAITGTQPVVTLFGNDDVSPHTSLARWADLVVVAPVTAASLARYAHGESSDAVSATLLATRAPIMLAPAMHTEMWENEATRQNIALVRDLGYQIVEPDVGELAGGDIGVGRLREPDEIVEIIVGHFTSGVLAGVNVLITAGGTREPIDPVRYIGNRSSGKMGVALAREAAARGGAVTLVTTVGDPVISGVTVVIVETAVEMAEAVWALAPSSDIAIMAAAVADFMPASIGETKLKRADGAPNIDLVPTPDVLKGVHDSSPRPFLVGFAAETGSLGDAVDKAARKRVDLLVANDVSKAGSGFGSDTNEVAIMDSDGIVAELPLMPKDEVAVAIWDEVVARRGQA